jgi:RHS repeat-associated protein
VFKPSRSMAFTCGVVCAAAAFLGLPIGAFATTLPSTITENTTLSAVGNPYTGATTIESGVTLTVEPGVHFTEANFTVKGTLDAEGTAEDPVLFEGTSQAAITFEPGSGASVLDQVEVLNAGHEGTGTSSRAAIEIKQSSPTIVNSTIRESGYSAIKVVDGGAPEIADNQILDSHRWAIDFDADPGDTGEIDIHDNFIEGNKIDGGIDVTLSTSSVTAKTLGGNTVLDTEGIGLRYGGPEIPGDVTENTLVGNKDNTIQISGFVLKSSTWNDGGIKVRANAIEVASAATLNVTPGLHFTEANFTVKGALKAEGTAEEPIVFEGTSQAAITFEPGSGASVLDQVEVLNAGKEACCGKSRAAIEVKKASPTIVNSTVDGSGYSAIKVRDGGAPEIANNDLLDSRNAPIDFDANEGEPGEINIHDNFIEGSEVGGGINVSVSGSAVTAKTLSANTVIGTKGGAGLRYVGPEIPGNITENTLSGNQSNLIEISGTVAKSSTWNDGGAKVRANAIDVAKAATLDITAGVHFTEANFTVKGTLDAEGTAEDPVLFEGTSQAAITFEPGSGASVLDQVEVLNAGHEGTGTSSRAAIEIKQSSPTIVNSTIRESGYSAIKVVDGGAPEIADNQILDSHRWAIDFDADPGDTGEIDIHDNFIEGNKIDGGIDVTLSTSSVTAKTLGGNTVLDTEGIGLRYGGPEIPGDVTENTLVGNKDNTIQISGFVLKSSTWNDGGIKVRANAIEVASAATLNVTPGLHFTEANFTVKGALKAEGTAEEPIVFEGTSQAAITFEPGSGASVLDQVEVLNAGKEACCGKSRAAIEVKKASPTIVNSTVDGSGYSAIKVRDGGAPEIANNDLLDSRNAPIDFDANEGEPGEINIHDNFIEGSEVGGGINVSVSGSAVTAKTLSANTVIGTKGGAGLRYVGPEIPGNITENTLSGNQSNLIEISGTVAKSSTWNDGGAPIRVNGEVTVVSGAALTITKGVFMMNPNFTVQGTLKAEGTTAEPVVFTGKDELAPGEWRSIKFETTSSASILDHTEIAYGGSTSNGGMIEVKKSSPKIRNSTIRKAKYYGIKVTESGSPTIEWNRFRANTNGLSYSGTGNLSTPNNDWGCANGPKPAGCGDSVTSNIKWNPAVQLPEMAGHCWGQESQCGEGADPVSLATGHLSYSHRDLLLTNKSRIPLELERAYSSGSGVDAGFGQGWSQTGLASATQLESGDVLIVRQDGRQDLFVKTGENAYKAPSGVTSRLAKVEGTFQLITLERMVYRFDESGRIASITDDHGLKTTYGYDGSGRLATITDPSGQTLTFSYNASNHVASIKDSTGREVKYTYSGAGDLATVTDAFGGVTEYTYDSGHRLKTIKDPRGNVILKNTYDAQGRIIEQRDGLENLWKLEYGSDETVVTEPEGGEITYGFDDQDRVISETDQLGHTTATSYDAAGNVDEIIKPGGGAKWQFGHDAAGNLTSVVDPEEGEQSYEYDGQNRLTSFTGEREETWDFEWDADNDLIEITDPVEGETTFTHNAAGQPLTITDPNEHTTTFTYDSRGNRLTDEDALEHTTSFGYNSRNHLTSKAKPGLEAEVLGRNALGDLLSKTTPEGHKTEYAYDANGMLTEITDPAEGVWEIERNAMERPTAYVDPQEQRREIDYDGNLNRVKVTDRRGNETTYEYDLANQLSEVVRPEGGDWEFEYDARGNRTEVVDPRESATTYEYDLLDRITEAAEPLEAVTKYLYDPAGNLTFVTDPRENTTSFAYDELGRLTDIYQPLGKTTSFTYDGVGNRLTRTTAASVADYSYDAADRLQVISDGASVLRSFDYDAADRMVGAVDAQNAELEIGYDDDGQVVSIYDGRGQTVSREYDSRGNPIVQTDGRGTLEYDYNSLNRMTSLTDPQSKALGFGYDPEGNLTEVELRNGVITTNAYDDAGRLVATTSKKAETVLESLEYEYDPFGNRIAQVDRLSQETTYGYDTLNRLTEFNPPGEGSTSYDYDAAGNRTEAGATTYSFNDLNQLTSASDGTTYDYDDAGRLVEIDDGEQATIYGWNALDELTGVDTGTQEIEYVYDALGRQVKRNDGSTIRLSHYGDLSDVPIFDADVEGQPTMSYVQGPGGMVEQRSGEATSFPLEDVHGDIMTLVDGEGGVSSRQTYDPWGAQISGPALEMGYLGAQQRRSDPATELVQMGVRPYSPALGSFQTEDRILGHLGIGITFNRYAYVGDNPLLYFDLSGRDFLDDVGGVVGDTWDHTGGAAWDWTAGGRTAVGIAGDGNGGWLSEAPDFVSDQAQNFVKQINFSTEELVANVSTIIIGHGICVAAGAGASAVGTPAAGAAAVITCVTADSIGAASTINDIFDDENELWPNASTLE